MFLNTLNKWIRLDARRNKEGVCAEMSVGEEMFVFKARPEYNEIVYFRRIKEEK